MYNVRNPREVATNVLNCDTVVSEFESLSRHYIPFQTNTLRKCMNLLPHLDRSTVIL